MQFKSRQNQGSPATIVVPELLSALPGGTGVGMVHGQAPFGSRDPGGVALGSASAHSHGSTPTHGHRPGGALGEWDVGVPGSTPRRPGGQDFSPASR